jgi:hypothetical protein
MGRKLNKGQQEIFNLRQELFTRLFGLLAIDSHQRAELIFEGSDRSLVRLDSVRERQRDRETETERERQRDRETDRETERDRERSTETEIER